MASPQNYPAPWFKHHLAEYHRDTSGMTMEEKGIYLSLQVLYWEHNGSLPPNVARRLGIQGSQMEFLQEILDTHFPDSKHLGLDQQREEMLRVSDRARKAAQQRHKPERTPPKVLASAAPEITPESDPDDF